MARKTKSGGLPTGGIVMVAAFCLLAGGAGIGYLWQKSQIHKLGLSIRAHEARHEELKRHHAMLERTLAMICSPKELEERARRMRLEVGPPQESQIVRLREPMAPAMTAGEQRILAGRGEAREGVN